MALESAGVYWIPLYDILEERGLKVYLVNARHTKNLPGRKSDVQESQWLLKLHTYGVAEQLVPTIFKDSDPAHLLAAAGTARDWGGDLRSTNAESIDADGHSVGECDRRSERGDWTDDRTDHRRWGT